MDGRSIVISGGEEKDRFTKIETIIAGKKVAVVDQYMVLKTGENIGIGEIRKLQSWLIGKSFGGLGKIAVISRANLLTIEAQQAMLKMLEEPLQDVTIILCVSSVHKLLPTVVSRCFPIHIRSQYPLRGESNTLPILNVAIDSFDTLSIAARLGMAARIPTEREEAKRWVQTVLEIYRRGLLTSLDIVSEVGVDWKRILTAKQHLVLLSNLYGDIESNGNIRLAAEHAFLAW